MHIENINITLNGGPSAITRAFIEAMMRGPELNEDGDQPATAAPGSVATNPVANMPNIGDQWPEQGGIYVGRGRGRDGGRDYSLILPADKSTIFEKRSLGTYGTDVTGATSDHDGIANTIALAAAGSDLCKEALAVEIEGHKDFYLMSRTDARLCWANVPELFEKEWYLTSTQYSSGHAWGQHFSDGNQSYYGKKIEARARFCRRSYL